MPRGRPLQLRLRLPPSIRSERCPDSIAGTTSSAVELAVRRRRAPDISESWARSAATGAAERMVKGVGIGRDELPRLLTRREFGARTARAPGVVDATRSAAVRPALAARRGLLGQRATTFLWVTAPPSTSTGLDNPERAHAWTMSRAGRASCPDQQLMLGRDARSRARRSAGNRFWRTRVDAWMR